MFDNSKVVDINVMIPELRKENCELKSLKRNDDGSISFTFADANGAELIHREFKPSKVIGGKTLNDEEFKKNVSLITSRIAHITRAFVTQETFEKIKTSQTDVDQAWAEYTKMTAGALGVDGTGMVGKAKGVKCALKVIYKNSKGKFYSSLPQVAPFISTENHPKTFVANAQYDKFTIERVTPDKEEDVFKPASTPLTPAGEAAPAADVW